MEMQLENLEAVSSMIKNARRSLGISQKELAKSCGLSQSMIARLEGDIVKLNPSYREVYNVMSRLSSMGTSMSKARLVSKTASDIMHRNVVMLNTHDSVEKAIKIIRSYDFAYIPVVDDSRAVAGTVYQKDILNAATNRPAEVSRIEIGSIMSHALPQVDRKTSVIMLKPFLENFGSVLVTDKGKILGIITAYDVLKLV